MKKITIFTFFVLLTFNLLAQSKCTLNGVIRDNATGEELIGATIYITGLKTGTVSNLYGFYSLTLPREKYSITYSFMGYESQTIEVDLKDANEKKQDIHLATTSRTLSEIQVIGEKKNTNVAKVEMSTNQLSIKTIQKIPALMGEIDVLKTIQLLPGVQSSGEGSSGFYVRGGNVDQNLILLDDATVYNAAHLGGLFSVFNQDAVKDIKLYKGGIPAEYGGRLSSLLDIRMKEGNMKKLTVTGGVGIISSRLTIESPLFKEKSSFIVSGRRTYADVFFPLLRDTTIKKSKAYFYDLNAKVNLVINDNNRIFLSGYFGDDVMDFAKQFKMRYGNGTFTFRYNHLFSKKLFSNITLIYSKFDYSMGTPESAVSFDWNSNIIDQTFRNDYNWYANPNNTVKFGYSITYHTFKPGYVKKNNENSIFNDMSLPDNYAMEYNVFASNEQKIGDKLTLQYGLRWSAFQNMGKGIFYVYDRANADKYTVVDSLKYKSKELFNLEQNFEPRINLVYKINESLSLKASYNRTSQYIHLATNTMSATPLDVWFPSTPNVKPQKADEGAIGLFKDFFNNALETSVEVYYKKMYNVIDFRDHAQLFINKYFEGELRIGDGYSYGAEFFVKKQEGNFTGWISYTWSKTMRTIPEINNGNEFAAPYDKPHNLSIVASYDITPRLNISTNWIYSTGAPRTVPVGRYNYQGMIVPIYSDRNSVRIPDYHRMDLSVTLEGKKYKKDGTLKKYQGSWNFSIYNVYNRHNAYSIVFKQNDTNPEITEAQKLYLFKTFPSITYNFKF